jgi:hypothetical protein
MPTVLVASPRLVAAGANTSAMSVVEGEAANYTVALSCNNATTPITLVLFDSAAAAAGGPCLMLLPSEVTWPAGAWTTPQTVLLLAPDNAAADGPAAGAGQAGAKATARLQHYLRLGGTPSLDAAIVLVNVFGGSRACKSRIGQAPVGWASPPGRAVTAGSYTHTGRRLTDNMRCSLAHPVLPAIPPSQHHPLQTTTTPARALCRGTPCLWWRVGLPAWLAGR